MIYISIYNSKRSALCRLAGTAHTLESADCCGSTSCASSLEATQGQMDGFFGQFPYKCHQNRVASVGVDCRFAHGLPPGWNYLNPDPPISGMWCTFNFRLRFPHLLAGFPRSHIYSHMREIFCWSYDIGASIQGVQRGLQMQDLRVLLPACRGHRNWLVSGFRAISEEVKAAALAN